MYKILFVCTGNICRSPMAEAIMADLIRQRGMEEQISVDSAGTIGYHAGESADPRTLAVLEAHKVPYAGKAGQVDISDLKDFDLVIGMAGEHIEYLKSLVPENLHSKIKLLMEFAPDSSQTEVPDPYYAGGFEGVYELIYPACQGLLKYVEVQLKIQTN